MNPIYIGDKEIKAKVLYAGANRWNGRVFENASKPFKPGTRKPELDYQDAVMLGRTLGVPVFETFLKLEVTQPDGTVCTVHDERSHTFTRIWWNFFTLLGLCTVGNAVGSGFGQGSLGTKDTAAGTFSPNMNVATNGARPVPVYGSAVALLATTLGIVLGTGRREERFNDFALQSIIASGNGAGQLAYSAQNAPVITWDSATDKFTGTHVRIFNNNSGSTIAVGEVGIYGSEQLIESANGFLLCRDLLPAAVSVVNAAQLTVTWTISVTYPAAVSNDPPVAPTGSAVSPLINSATTSQGWYDEEHRNPRLWRSIQQWLQYIRNKGQ